MSLDIYGGMSTTQKAHAKVNKIYHAKTPDEFAIADENGHLPIPERGVNLRHLREIWLYGDEDGVLPQSDAELQQMTGASHAQIRRRFPALVREREEFLREAVLAKKQNITSVMVNDAAMTEHQRITKVLKDQMDEVEFELVAADVGTGHHKAMMKMFLDLKDRWEKDTGVYAVKAAAAAVIKETELEDARDEREELRDPAKGKKVANVKQLKSNPAFDV